MGCGAGGSERMSRRGVGAEMRRWSAGFDWQNEAELAVRKRRRAIPGAAATRSCGRRIPDASAFLGLIVARSRHPSWNGHNGFMPPNMGNQSKDVVRV